jgi:uncharacterized protein
MWHCSTAIILLILNRITLLEKAAPALSRMVSCIPAVPSGAIFSRFLEVLYFHGASDEILVDAHPHVGTDRLPAIMKNIRETIIQAGGEVHFNTRVDDFIIEGDAVKGIVTAGGERITGEAVILATGHSARDMYELLHKKDIQLEAKTWAMGVRVEHPQELIDQIQYHNPEGRGDYLPAASYNFSCQVQGRGVYSFCMCPGWHHCACHDRSR